MKLATLTVVLGGLLVMGGCADSIYPRLPGLPGTSPNTSSTLLSPTEQQKAISDLAPEQKTHGAAAAKEIERRD